ncbi:hypothetical protein B2I21_09735 [Chryseobacterium mucoviscidosis]|nr:hypothetical protein B2I21_09735 [Chryseobacterium mucoviscidosis]
MANRYANLVGSKKISEDFNNINIGFDRVQAEMDTKGTPADAQAKADAAKAAAIAAAAADLAAHKQRGADEHPTAKGNAAGFMSAADKLLMDARTNAATPDTLMQRDAEGRAKVAAPAVADDIARKAETDAVQTKLDSHAADMVKHVTQAEHDKLNGIAAGAEVNQNAFSKINDVSAGSKTDTVTLVGGTGITITTDPANKRVSFTATGEATPGPHALSHIQGGTDVIPDAETGGVSGLMSGADAQYLRVGVPERFDEIEVYVADQIAAIPPVNDATQTEKGITMLSDATNGTRSNVAATEKAVGLAFQAGVERKAEVVAALNSIGVSASTSENWDSLIAKMSGVIRATGTASVSQVLAGSTFSNASGNNRTGTMPNRGAGGAITPGTTAQVKAAGYYNTDIVVPGEPNLRGDVILKNYSIYGVAGKYEPNQVVNSPITLYSTGVVKPARYLHWLTIPAGKSFFFVPSFTNAYISFNAGSESNPLSSTNIVLIDSTGREVVITFNSANGAWATSTIYIMFLQVDRVNRRYRYTYKPTVSSSNISTDWVTPGTFNWDNDIKIQFQYLNQSVVISQGTNTVIIPDDAFSVYY